MNFGNNSNFMQTLSDRVNNTSTALAQALAQASSQRRNNKQNYNSSIPLMQTNNNQQQQNNSTGSLLSGAGNLLKTGADLYKTFGSNTGTSTTSDGGIFGSTADSLLNGTSSSGGIFGSDADSLLGETSSTGGIFGSDADSLLSSGGGGYGSLILGGARAGSSALNGGDWTSDVPQSFFGINSEDDSDIMQSIKGAGNGAMMGASFGPIGMAIGAALGLGSSFLDDI